MSHTIQKGTAARRSLATLTALNKFWGPAGTVHEVRLAECTGSDGKHRPYIASQYFDNPSAASAAIEQAARVHRPGAVYWTPNACDPRLLARQSGDWECYPKATTKDSEIERRLWLVVDIDPIRPADIPSNPSELRAAKNTADRLFRYLRRQGWPDCYRGTSANGYRLWYRIDLPNSDEMTALVKGVLTALHEKFGNRNVSIDTSLANAATLDRVMGTMNKKGSGDIEQQRIHRMAKLTRSPGRKPKPVPIPKLQAMAAAVAPCRPATSRPQQTGKLDVDSWLADRGVGFKTQKNGRGTKYLLDQCPFNPDHGGKDTAILQSDDGRLSFKCLHNRCSDYRWSDLKEILGAPQAEHHRESIAGIANMRMGGHEIGDPWEELVPFDRSIVLGAFPVKSLPKPWGAWVQTVSDSVQVPPEMPAMVSMGIVSMAAASRYEIVVDAGRDWVEPLVAWTCAVSDSGTCKSVVVKMASRPMQEVIDDLRRRWSEQKKRANEVPEDSIDTELLDLCWDQARLAGSSVSWEQRVDTDLRIEFLRARQDATDPPPSPDFVHGDITLEALTEVRAEQGEAAVISSEAGIFNVMGGMYSHDGQANLDALLSGYDCEPFSRRRVGRRTVRGDGPLVIAITPQPAVLEQMQRHQVIRGRGVLGRFLYARCPVLLGTRVANSPQLDQNDVEEYDAQVKAIMRRPTELTQLTLSAEAKCEFDKWFTEVEQMLARGALLANMRDWGGKLVGRTCRIAALLHIMERRQTCTEISATTFVHAIEIARWSIPHALAVYAIVAMDQRIHTAMAIRDSIVKHGWTTFRGRQLFESVKGRSCISSMDDLREPLRLLADHRYLRVVADPKQPERPGRPRGPLYEVNPAVFSTK